MKTVTSEEMRALDRKASEEFGIPSLLLMENAARGTADVVSAELPSGSITVFAGKGNNGGDGFAAARHLHNRGFKVNVLLLADSKNLKGDASLNFQIISKMKIPVTEIRDSAAEKEISVFISEADLIVDALFGTGLRSALEGIYLSAVQAINRSGKRVISIDIPSGLDSDTGEVRSAAVKASATAVLGIMKKGLLTGRGPECTGKLYVVDISIPRVCLQDAGRGSPD